MTPVWSWGRLHRAEHHLVRPAFLDQAVQAIAASGPPALCYGKGRSYGDVCTNERGRLVVTDQLDRLMAFDRTTGILRAEAGLTLDRLLQVAVPLGWFVPVTPGTKFVTLGGAVANDVHGKNHESAGTFGCHVLRLGLARSTGEILTLSRDDHPDLFAATIGGLGLTGIILWVELQLVAISSASIDHETLAQADLDAFFRLAEESRDWPFTAAWVDCFATGAALGRGFFMRGRPAAHGGLVAHRDPRLSMPLDAPGVLLNPATMRLFNEAYQRRPWALGRKTVHYDSVFYPLDAIGQWNRLYGPRGFFQHQSVVPRANAVGATRKLLELTAEHRQGSFLVVLKMLGERASPGVLSFPMPGVTLALDFPNKGDTTRRLLDKMSDIVLTAGGRLYPAKDATMSGEAFRTGYPAWTTLEAQRDPGMNSDFWRRVTRQAQ